MHGENTFEWTWINKEIFAPFKSRLMVIELGWEQWRSRCRLDQAFLKSGHSEHGFSRPQAGLLMGMYCVVTREGGLVYVRVISVDVSGFVPDRMKDRK